MPRGLPVVTHRLLVRPPHEDDRAALVRLWCDPEFMIFSDGVLNDSSANKRFDRMLEVAEEIALAKQPIIERDSGLLVGYTGVDWFDLDGDRRLECGYRLARPHRNKGYATEASAALLATAVGRHHGDIFAIIHFKNEISQRVIGKLGFDILRQANYQRATAEPVSAAFWRLPSGERVAAPIALAVVAVRSLLLAARS